jgi:signal transduction histidine kinase/CheY-like chemotaxis protein
LRIVTTFLIVSLLCISPFYAQSGDAISKDSTPLSERQQQINEVDSLVRFTRNQFYKNNYDLTIEVGDKTLKLAREIGDYRSIFSVSSLMGNAFLQIEDTIQAKRIFMEAVAEAESLQNKEIPSDTLLKAYSTDRSILTARIDLGNYYALQKKPEPAIALYKETIPLAEKLQDTSHLFILNFNLAELHLDNKDVKNAEYYVSQTNSYINKETVDAYRAVAKLNVGKLNFLKGQPNLARENLDQSIALAQKSGYTDPLIEGYEYLAKADSLLGDHKMAYANLMRADHYKQEKYKTDKIRAIETVTAKFKLNQYQQELKAQALQNQVNRETAKRETTILWVKIASAILFVSSIFLFISYRRRKRLLVDVIDKNKKYLLEKKKTEELSRAKSILFSNITHELRTPMYGIIGVSSILNSDKKLKHHDENLKSLKFSANHLLGLINKVLQLNQIDATKKEELHKVEFNVYELVKNIVKSSKFINTEHPNTFEVTINDDVPEFLMGDEMKLSQVLINLISNATKFTQNGTVSVVVSRKEDVEKQVCLEFVVQDTGEGISKEKQSLLFNEFAQTESTDDYQHTGMGLPIVKRILDLYNSDLKIESEPSKGTRVSFTICMDRSEKTEEKTQPSTEENGSLLKGKCILTVDDNKINLLVTKKFLELYGAKVITADGGKKAIALTKEEAIDLILMDINMPEMNGFETTEAIRSFNEDIPIIALTAVEKEKVTGKNSFNLMNGIIIKPYKNEDFIETIVKYTDTITI